MVLAAAAIAGAVTNRSRSMFNGQAFAGAYSGAVEWRGNPPPIPLTIVQIRVLIRRTPYGDHDCRAPLQRWSAGGKAVFFFRFETQSYYTLDGQRRPSIFVQAAKRAVSCGGALLAVDALMVGSQCMDLALFVCSCTDLLCHGNLM